jgi:hypothetical protein
LYFIGLSLRSTSKTIAAFIERSNILPYGIGYRNSIQRMFSQTKRSKARITAFVVDEILIQIGNNNTDDAWLWVAVESIHYRILAEIFLKSLTKLYFGNKRTSLQKLLATPKEQLGS